MRRAAVKHSRGEGTELSVQQFRMKQPVIKGSLSLARIETVCSVSAVPALAFSVAAQLASVPGTASLHFLLQSSHGLSQRRSPLWDIYCL